MSLTRFQLVIFGVVGVIVIIAILVLTGVIPVGERPPSEFTLTVWGFQDEPGLWRLIADAYAEPNPNAKIEYTVKDPHTYEAELVNALAAGRGPDIFLLKDSWLEKHRDKVKPLAEGTLGYQARNTRNALADGVSATLISQKNELWGTALAFDTLALFYNRDYFNSANIPNPPATWDEFAANVEALTRFTPLGAIRRSGVALGTAANVEHAADILTALIYQAGGAVTDARQRLAVLGGSPATKALEFYTSFSNSAKKTYSWNTHFQNSLQAFASGETAMTFGYAADVTRVVALNAQLNFDVAPLPQAAGAETQVNYGRFNFLAVSRSSTQADDAWRFLQWLQGKDIQKTYLDAAGLPPTRRDLVTAKPPREYLVPFYDQALSARGFPIPADDSLGVIFGDMIESVVNRRFPPEQAIEWANGQIGSRIREVR